MSSHIVFFPIIVDDGRLGIIVLFVLANAVVKLISSQAQLTNSLGKDSLHIGVLSFCPIVLISHVSPSYFLIESEPFSLFDTYLYLLGLFLLIFVILFFSFLFVELVPAIQVSPVGFLPIHVESMSSNINDYFRRVKVLHQYRSLWVRQLGNLVSIDHLILLWLKEQAEVSFSVLIEFVVLLHLLKGI